MANKITHWKTQDGVVVALRDMEDTHLFNALAFMVRRREQAKKLELYRLAESFTASVNALHAECERREPNAFGAGILQLDEPEEPRALAPWYDTSGEDEP